MQETRTGATTTFTVDLQAGLSQVLSDGAHTYLYGNGRIAQQDSAGRSYFLGDALGSVRQVVNAQGVVTLARSYAPYGAVRASSGEGASSYGFTGEWQDASRVYLRARWYSPGSGRFLTRDSWEGDSEFSMSYNDWVYSYENPIIFTDPSGLVAYDRFQAANYATKWAMSINPVYGRFGDSDCTNFVSQAMKAGGFPEDNDWFFNRTFTQDPGRCTGYHYPTPPLPCEMTCSNLQRWFEKLNTWYDTQTKAFCGTSWALTDNLYGYLTKTRGFPATVMKDPDGLPQGFEYIDLVGKAQLGDVVFYHQEDSDYVAQGKGIYNHAAIIIGWKPLTEKGKSNNEYPQIVPHVSDHSATYSVDAGDRGINDTSSPAQELVIVHIPDNILWPSSYRKCENW